MTVSGNRDITTRALAVLLQVSEKRLHTARPGDTVCVPVTTMRELAEAIEAKYPGLIADARRIAKERA